VLIVTPGLLVRTKRGSRMGIVVEVFMDLNPKDPWIRVCWTHPKDTYEWCKMSGLEFVDAKNKGGLEAPPADDS
jgi:hypothetical protein